MNEDNPDTKVHYDVQKLTKFGWTNYFSHVPDKKRAQNYARKAAKTLDRYGKPLPNTYRVMKVETTSTPINHYAGKEPK